MRISDWSSDVCSSDLTSAGLGVETARCLVAHGAHVVGTARDIAKAEQATAVVRAAAAAGGGSFELLEMDLASFASVRAASEVLKAAGQPIDTVIANAGVMATPFGPTEAGLTGKASGRERVCQYV